MNVKKYLNRIEIEQTEITKDLETLKLLQKKHLLTVPFENLDIHWQRPIILDPKNFYEKIVDEKRGGFCYELNGLFNELLNEIGFPSKIISAKVMQRDGNFGAEYDHLVILTKIGEEEFLVDVGFGDFIVEPLKFILEVEQIDTNGTFLIRKFDENYFEVVKKDGENWQSEYIFKELARDLTEFTEMCNFHQTSPESHFTHGKLCSIMNKNGRKTLTDKKFIETINGEKIENEITSDDEFNQILECEFGISLNS
ncbi:MAG TPA: arylamine N-acetyltransferase [Pyrinomonadaceae bacterium]|nr:arylamine N-acetyltransferase [Pyrinomonadaceae bacterium]